MAPTNCHIMRATPWYPVAPCHVPVRVRLKASQEKIKEVAAQVLFYASSMRPDFPLYYVRKPRVTNREVTLMHHTSQVKRDVTPL